MTLRSRLPDSLPPEFSTADAAQAGASRSRLRADDLRAPFRGARSRSQPDLLATCRAYAAVAAHPFAFSHTTAARLLGLPVPDRLGGAIHVMTMGQPPRMAGVVGHRASVVAGIVRHGVPVVAPLVALSQMASLLEIEDLVVLGDAIVRRRHSLATPRDLEAVGEPGARGVRRLRAAIALVRAGTDSPQETRLRLALIRHGLPEPVVRHEVIDGDGYFVGTPDLAYVAERVAIEYEGDGHRVDLRTFRDDIERRERFEQAGWRVVRVTADHLRAPAALASRIRFVLAQRR